MKLLSKLFSIVFVSMVCIVGFRSIVQADQIPDTAPTYYVYDPEHYLNHDVIEKVKDLNAKYKDSKLKPQVAIAIVDHLDSNIESTAKDVASKWKIGFNDTNAGMLVLIDVKNHKIRTELSNTLQSKMSSYDTDSLNDSIKSDFRAGNYSAGMLNYLSQLDSKLSSFSFGSKSNESFNGTGFTRFSSKSGLMSISDFVMMTLGTLAVVLLPFFLFKMIVLFLGGERRVASTVEFPTGFKMLPRDEVEDKDPKDVAADNFKEIVDSSRRAPKYISDGQRGIYRDSDDLARNMLLASTLISSSSHTKDEDTSHDSYTPSSHDSQIYSTPTYHTPDTSSWSGGGFDGGGSTGSW